MRTLRLPSLKLRSLRVRRMVARIASWDRNTFGPTSILRIRQDEIAVMGAEGAVNIIYRRELQADANGRTGKIDEYRERFASPFVAAERGFIDDVIEPHETRPKIIKALRLLATKVDTMPRKKHGNIPL